MLLILSLARHGAVGLLNPRSMALSRLSVLRVSTSSPSSSSTQLNPYPNPNNPTPPPAPRRRPSSNVINWYPGHISSAEKQLSTTLKSCDIVIEVRDGRIPLSTSHPSVLEWSGGKPRVVVVTRPDMVPKNAQREWEGFWKTLSIGEAGVDEFGIERVEDKDMLNRIKQVEDLRRLYTDKSNKYDDDAYISLSYTYVNGKSGGKPLIKLKRMIQKECLHVTARRKSRGLEPRALRVGVIGYPNVGKSAIINRILGRKRVKSADIPGLTRSLTWVKVKAERDSTGALKGASSLDRTFELLDSPGIIPADLVDQHGAMLLAACNSIGRNAYDNQNVCIYFLDTIFELFDQGKEKVYFPKLRELSSKRWGVDMFGDNGDLIVENGEDVLHAVADATCKGDLENASLKILQDFRHGRLGEVCLQIAPRGGRRKEEKEDEEGEGEGREGAKGVEGGVGSEEAREIELRRESAKVELNEKGIELPVTHAPTTKGKFEGW